MDRDAPPNDTRTQLKLARRLARDRYQLVAAALKREACIRRHYRHKQSGLAWISGGRILAPDGVNRNNNDTDNRNNNLGFRVASTLRRLSRRDHGPAGRALEGVQGCS